MSPPIFVNLALKVFGLLFLINHVSSSDYSALLPRLYQKAAASYRPLIVLIDSNYLQSDRQSFRRPPKSNADEYNELEYKASPLSNLLHIQKNKRNQNTNFYKPQNNHKIQKKLHNALLPMQKRKVTRDNIILRSPIIRNLLRISNNLHCQARVECKAQCDSKYTGNKNNNCVNKCESKFECEEPEESGCDECEANSCDDNNCQGSTKGYAVTDPSVGCPEC